MCAAYALLAMPATPPSEPSRESSSSLVLDLAEIDAHALALAGGKAVNLGELIRAGLPVPPGVCVLTDAYRQVAATAGFTTVLDRLAATPVSGTTTLAALAGEARAAMLAAPVPDLVARAVVDGYRRLGPDVPVAVRSSATAEDLPHASFAGQQDTFLNVVGPDATLQAVRRCWASLWTDRAVTYRASNGIDPRTVALAVVIQRMVDTAVAGVLFTANPVTGRRGHAVIDASPGLGEAVVSGSVNPDHFVIDSASDAILERRLGDKRIMVRAQPGGGTERVEQPGAAGDACVTDDQVRALAALGVRVEAHYGAPQDIEWAIDAGGRLWLTQARPITTLYPLPASAPSPGDDLRVYFCFSVAQGLYRPITPMGLAGFRILASAASEVLGFPVAEPLAGPTRYAEAGQRLFADLTGVLRSPAGRELMPRVLDFMEARSAVVLRGLIADPRLSLNRSWLSFVRRGLRIAVRFRIPVTAVRALARPDDFHDHAEQIGVDLAKRLAVTDTATAAERLRRVEEILFGECISMVPRIMPGPGAGLAMLGIAGKMLGEDARSEDLQTVLRALPRNVTTEMDLALWDLAGRIRADRDAAAVFRDVSPDQLADDFRAGVLPPVVQNGLSAFLRHYGHRAVAEIDIGIPRWSDDPRHIFGVITNYLRLEDASLAPDALFARGAAEAAAMIDTLAARAQRRGRLRGRAVRFALSRARALAGARELPKFYLILAVAAVRRQLVLVGAELAARGRLAAKDDVFFVDLKEAAAGLAGRDLRELIPPRRAAYDLELRRRHVPRVMLSDGTEPEAESGAAKDGALVGTPASAGTVTAAARVIFDPIGAHLEPGEILVAPSTDPGWTPLFLTAGGLVMEMGGANSHGAVVAREYGIPAVVGVPHATARIATGQRITVDGGRGTVSAD